MTMFSRVFFIFYAFGSGSSSQLKFTAGPVLPNHSVSLLQSHSASISVTINFERELFHSSVSH